MGLNETPSSERIHIGIFGKRNAGKSSVINAITNQNLAIVSEQKGTTTDPVYKAMELLPLGPVMIVDTPGFDDEGTLGELRIRHSIESNRISLFHTPPYLSYPSSHRNSLHTSCSYFLMQLSFRSIIHFRTDSGKTFI